MAAKHSTMGYTFSGHISTHINPYSRSQLYHLHRRTRIQLIVYTGVYIIYLHLSPSYTHGTRSTLGSTQVHPPQDGPYTAQCVMTYQCVCVIYLGPSRTLHRWNQVNLGIDQGPSSLRWTIFSLHTSMYVMYLVPSCTLFLSYTDGTRSTQVCPPQDEPYTAQCVMTYQCVCDIHVPSSELYLVPQLYKGTISMDHPMTQVRAVPCSQLHR